MPRRSPVLDSPRHDYRTDAKGDFTRRNKGDRDYARTRREYSGDDSRRDSSKYIGRKYADDEDQARRGKERERDASDIGGSGRDRRRQSSPGDDRRNRDRYDSRRERDRSPRRDRERERVGPSSSRRSASPPRRSSRARSGSRSPSAVDKDLEAKMKPNFGASGLLAAATNTVKNADGSSTLLKYNEPPEARKPNVGWRLYVFKGSEQVDLLHIHRQSAYLIGRDHTVADIPIDHPSCSKQHAVIQYRYIQTKDEYGVSKGSVKPFVIDLESTNGTHVNDETIPTTRFYELKPSDVLKFGQSTREYVLLHDEVS